MKDHIEMRRPSVKNAAKRLRRYGYQKIQVRKPERYANKRASARTPAITRVDD